MKPTGTQMMVASALVVAALVFSVGGPGIHAGGGHAYAGKLSALHAAADGMEGRDRAGLSEALDAGAAMLERDAAGLVTTTAQAERFVRGVLGFGYTAFAVKKYPAVAAAVQAELEKATGADDVRMTPEIRSRVVESLRESAAAIR